jgi:hypothetical protein
VRRSAKQPARAASAVALLGALPGLPLPAFAADTLREALFDDSELMLHLRSYVFDRHSPGPVANEAWAVGGWLGYESGWWADRLRLGVVGYASLPVWAPPDSGGTSLLGAQQQSLAVIGQAYLSLKWADQVLTGGRFEMHQPEVNPNDIRMIANTFEGAKIDAQVAGVKITASYLDAMKPIASTRFVDMATVAGAPADVSSPLWLIGFEGEPLAGSRWRLSSYHVPNVLTSSYADVAWHMPLGARYRLRLGAQAMYQSSTGDDLLTGAHFATGTGGLRADLQAGAATASVAYNQTARGADYRSPYGGWAGYTFMIVKSFNRAGERALLVGGSYDFAGHGLSGVLLNASVVFGSGAIDPASGAPLPDNTEYDMTLDWHFDSARWPSSVRPLKLRARMAYVDQGAAGHVTDYRWILNLPWMLR